MDIQQPGDAHETRLLSFSEAFKRLMKGRKLNQLHHNLSKALCPPHRMVMQKPIRSHLIQKMLALLRAGTNFHLGAFICTPTFSSDLRSSSHFRVFIFHPPSCPSHLLHLRASSALKRISSVKRASGSSCFILVIFHLHLPYARDTFTH